MVSISKKDYVKGTLSQRFYLFLFLFILEAAVRAMDIDISSTIFTKSTQLLGFADDLDIMGRNMEVVKEKFVALERKGSDFGLKVSDTKTEYMVMSPSNRQYGQNVTMNGPTFKVVDNFVYLGSQLNSDNNIVDEIKRRITLGNRSYFSMLKILRSQSVTQNLKCTLHKSVDQTSSHVWFGVVVHDAKAGTNASHIRKKSI